MPVIVPSCHSYQATTMRRLVLVLVLLLPRFLMALVQVQAQTVPFHPRPRSCSSN